jgi:hypothetical protein
MSFKSAMQGLVFALAVGALWGCGSASNNDQGASFTLFQMTPSSSSVPLSRSEEGTTSTGALTGTYGFQNNLLGQGIRLQRLFLRFFVEGSSEQPPETTVAIGAVLGPAGPAPADSDGSPGGSLPEGFESIPNTANISAFVLPPEIMSWLNLNRSLLPEPPYSITIEAYATGITTAGDRLDTNPLGTSVTITPDVVINPSGGGEGQEGADGTETVSGDESSEDL